MKNLLIYFWDAIRILTIALGVFDFMLVWSIVAVFLYRVRFDEASKIMTTHARAVASHVVPTAAAVSIVVFVGIVEMFVRFTMEITWRTPVLFVAYAVLALSMWRFARQQFVMYTASRNFYEKHLEYEREHGPG